MGIWLIFKLFLGDIDKCTGFVLCSELDHIETEINGHTAVARHDVPTKIQPICDRNGWFPRGNALLEIRLRLNDHEAINTGGSKCEERVAAAV